jgi:hypothetical protein
MLVPCALILEIFMIFNVFFSVFSISRELKELFQFRVKNINFHKILYKVIYIKKRSLAGSLKKVKKPIFLEISISYARGEKILQSHLFSKKFFQEYIKKPQIEKIMFDLSRGFEMTCTLPVVN